MEQLSGIKAHTLRIWEQRYNLLNPKRTETNIRYYDDGDLKLILNVAFLNENGFKISKIVAMSREEIRTVVLDMAEASMAQHDMIHGLTFCMIDMDEEGFERFLSTSIQKLGFEQTMFDVIYPFMAKIGILWQTGAITPAQEHFISNLVRQKLIVAIDCVNWSHGGKKFLLFLPEGELHEISLLFSSYLIKVNGHRVIYLGQSTPFGDLLSVYRLHQPDYLLTVLTSQPANDEAQAYLDSLSKQFPEAQILTSGYQVIDKGLTIPSNVRLMKDFGDFKEILGEISPVMQEK
nr:MerR family transcriptional regulator [Algoriphagus oliviformis]